MKNLQNQAVCTGTNDHGLEIVKALSEKDANSNHPCERSGRTALPLAFPDQKYCIIYADPPWYYNPRPHGKGKAFGAGAQGHYPVMRTEDICGGPGLADSGLGSTYATFEAGAFSASYCSGVM